MPECSTAIVGQQFELDVLAHLHVGTLVDAHLGQDSETPSKFTKAHMLGPKEAEEVQTDLIELAVALEGSKLGHGRD